MSWMNEIKGLDRGKVRVIPEDASNPHGRQIIEVFKDGQWVKMTTVDKNQARNILSEASINRVILG